MAAKYGRRQAYSTEKPGELARAAVSRYRLATK
jgi:hypothetical protein